MTSLKNDIWYLRVFFTNICWNCVFVELATNNFCLCPQSKGFSKMLWKSLEKIGMFIYHFTTTTLNFEIIKKKPQTIWLKYVPHTKFDWHRYEKIWMFIYRLTTTTLNCELSKKEKKNLEISLKYAQTLNLIKISSPVRAVEHYSTTDIRRRED